MKLHAILMTSAVCFLAATSFASAANTAQPPLEPQTAEPVALQPTPLPPAVADAPMPRSVPTYAPATLGDAGTMYSQKMADDATRVATIAPAAGGTAASVNTGKPARTIGGAQVLPANTIAQNIAGPSNLSTLEKAVTAAQLESSLGAPGPFTLFAPSNNAFNRLPKASFNSLLQPVNRDKLAKLINYHVVAGQHDATSIKADIAAGGGTATYETLAGETLKATTTPNGGIRITDNNGNRANVALADAYQANGVVHIVDRVVIPQ